MESTYVYGKMTCRRKLLIVVGCVLLLIAFIGMFIKIHIRRDPKKTIDEIKISASLKDGDIICRLGDRTWSLFFKDISPTDKRFSHLGIVRICNGNISVINAEGLAMRGSASEGNRAVHIVSAWQGEQHLVLGQLATEEQSNEITAIPRLLDMLEVTGDTITIDAADYNPRGVRRP
jgi:hypothetical protein